MIDLYYVYCINDKDLQEFTKTEVLVLQKNWSTLFFFVWLLLIFTKEMNSANV